MQFPMDTIEMLTHLTDQCGRGVRAYRVGTGDLPSYRETSVLRGSLGFYSSYPRRIVPEPNRLQARSGRVVDTRVPTTLY